MTGAMEVDNTWIRESTLGSGGFGVVQLWKNTSNSEKIAIKICKTGHAQISQRQNERWIEEISIMNQLQHPNIVATKPVPDEIKSINPSLPVLCMEYCRKGDLRRMLNESENCCGLKEPVAIQIMKDISGAVQYLHRCFLTHRDLKPENVVLQLMDDKVVYKLIDLGYAKALGHDSVYASIVGTLNYVAPELLWKQKYTCSVDYWSLGILFYEIITGSRPFLPEEQNAFTWKKHIETKSYDDISAQYVNGKIVFLQNIQDPTDMALCLRSALVDWFKIVLQWDSKKRGRQRQDNGSNDVVVFKMLKRILSKKVVRVFCVPQYRIYDYYIEHNTSLSALQSQVEIDTGINISSQELINSSGEVLNNNTTIDDTFLTLFRNEWTQPIDPPMLDLSADLVRLLAMPKVEMSHHDLKRCYSTAMFFVKKTFDLFSYYILALSMKIDLINTRLDTLLSKRDDMVSKIDSLNRESHSMIELLECDMRNGLGEWQREIQTALKKLDAFSETLNNLKIKCDQYSRIRETLRDFGNVNWMTEYQEFLNNVQQIIETCQPRTPQRKQQPIRMAKLIGKFLKFQQTQRNNPELTKIESQIKLMSTAQATKELLNLENFVDSAIELTIGYGRTISNLHKKWKNQKLALSSDVNTSSMDIEHNDDRAHSLETFSNSTDELASISCDTVIYDNLVIRYMMHDLISETYQSFFQIVNLDLDYDP